MGRIIAGRFFQSLRNALYSHVIAKRFIFFRHCETPEALWQSCQTKIVIARALPVAIFGN